MLVVQNVGWILGQRLKELITVRIIGYKAGDDIEEAYNNNKDLLTLRVDKSPPNQYHIVKSALLR